MALLAGFAFNFYRYSMKSAYRLLSQRSVTHDQFALLAQHLILLRIGILSGKLPFRRKSGCSLEEHVMIRFLLRSILCGGELRLLEHVLGVVSKGKIYFIVSSGAILLVLFGLFLISPGIAFLVITLIWSFGFVGCFET
ncbi:UNVERIFIED_CONTAM: hypothetical protein Sangu_2614800 [Sesamum angustifolium]|uniref:Uncharacterized protein n=1 Tax=Sesamum angustifolium TaxID=2727405 RepID=A0AAW2J5U3_9LAMI